ncbi:MAG: SH3 domain-containing protein [Anaerolineales bacterium]|nr:SH3 domain-containing protein [Anaerolineales bacterium]
MKRFWFKFFEMTLVVSAVSLWILVGAEQVDASEEAQQSTVLATIIYTEQINIRGGPSTVYYPIVGTAQPGEVFPAIGVSPGREWVAITFPSAPGGVGWVYATFVSISGGELNVVEPPPTPTPFATATVNPTFAAAFIFQPTTTRMPTFTPPPPLEIPQYTDVAPRSSGIASGAIVIGLLFIGIVVYVVSIALNRQ